MFKDYFKNISEKEYRGSDRVSYSFLKIFSEKGPKAIIEPQPEVSGAGVTLGSVVDKILSDDNYFIESEYTINDIEVDYSGTTHVSKVLCYLRDNRDTVLEVYDDEMLKRIFNILEFKRPPVVDDVFWAQVAVIYLENDGMKMLSRKELDIANTMVNTFKTHEFTKDIFNTTLDEEVINQAILYLDVLSIPCKVMIDKIICNHKTKRIRLLDIKTGAQSDFMKNFYGYKYYYQGALYHTAISMLIKQITEYIDYVVEPYFDFVYISRDNLYQPLIYRMDIQFIYKVQHGYETVLGNQITGIYQLLKDYKYYKDNDIYDIKRELKESNGVIEINTPK
jgi:hypothetical protein